MESPIKRGDRVVLRETLKVGISEFNARIDFVEDRGDYVYFGYTPVEPMRALWGCARLTAEGAPFGISLVKVRS